MPLASASDWGRIFEPRIHFGIRGGEPSIEPKSILKSPIAIRRRFFGSAGASSSHSFLVPRPAFLIPFRFFPMSLAHVPF